MSLRGLTVLFLIAKTNASANATASPAPQETLPLTGERPDTLVSEPPNARDEERNGVEDSGLVNQIAALLIKSTQALWKQDINSQLELKFACWRLKKVHPLSVHTELKPQLVDENVLSNRWFQAWVKYVESYNLEHPEEKVSIVEKLREKYDEHTLSMMLEQAKGEEDTSLQAIGTKLQLEQMSLWKAHKVPLNEIYIDLQAHPIFSTLLTGRALSIWNNFFTNFNPGQPMTLLDQLLHTFDDASLSKLLIASKWSKETAALATDLQLQLEKVWLRRRVTPELAFAHLKLGYTPYDLLQNPELKSWMRYAKMFWEETGTDVTLNKVIDGFFSADRIKIVIETARTDDIKELAGNLVKYMKEKVAAAQA